MKILDKFIDAIRLNDNYDEDDFFDDEVDDVEEEEHKPKSRFFSKMNDDLDEDEDFDDDNYEMPEKKSLFAKKSTTVTKPSKASSKITPMRKRSTNGLEVCIIKPTSMEDTRDIADTLIAHSTVLLNLEGLDVDVAQRIIDFSSGSCYSIGGALQKVSSYIFILTPDNVEVSGDFQEILNGAFELSSIRNNY